MSLVLIVISAFTMPYILASMAVESTIVRSLATGAVALVLGGAGLAIDAIRRRG